MPISERMAVATASETAFIAIASETRRKLLDARPRALPLILTLGWKGMLRRIDSSQAGRPSACATMKASIGSVRLSNVLTTRGGP